MTDNTSEHISDGPVAEHSVIEHPIESVKQSIDEAKDAMHRLEHVAPNALAEDEYEQTGG